MKVRYFMAPPGVSSYSTNEPGRDRHASYFFPPVNHGGPDSRIDPAQSVASGSFAASNPGWRYGSAPHDDRIGGDRRYEQGSNDDRRATVAGNGGGEEQRRAQQDDGRRQRKADRAVRPRQRRLAPP